MLHALLSFAFALSSAPSLSAGATDPVPDECMQIPASGDVPVGDLLPHMTDLAGPQAMIATSDGGAMAVGAMWGYLDTAFPTSLQGFSFWAQKLDDFGKPVWTSTYPAERSMEALVASEGIDGNFLIVGRVASFNHDLVLLSIDPRGEELWRKTYRLGIDTQPRAVVAARDGGFVIATSVREQSQSSTTAVIVKVDYSGDMLWTREIAPWTGPEATSDALVTDIETIGTGGYIAIGTSYADQQGQSWIVRLSSMGDIARVSILQNYNLQRLVSITGSGNYFLVVGNTLDSVFGSPWIATVDSNGHVITHNTVSWLNNSSPRSITSTSDGSVLIAGFVWRDQGSAALLLRLDETRDQVWCRHFSPHVRLGFSKAAVETSDRIIVWAGMRAGQGIANDYGWMIVTDHDGMPVP